MSFEKIGLMPELSQAVEDMGWMLPTDIQDEAMPLILGGGDVLMAAETGSGKTGAFCLPVLQIVSETLAEAAKPAKASSKAAAASVRMSTADRDSEFAVDKAGLLCQSRNSQRWQGGRATLGAAEGKVYYEVVMTDEGLCRVGWSAKQGTRELGLDDLGFGFGGTGKKSVSRRFDDYGEPFGLKDTIGCMLDFDAGEIRFSKNGRDHGVAFNLPAKLKGTPLFPACTVKNAELRFRFAAGDMKHLPAGYSALNDAKSLTAGQPALSKSKGPLALILEPSRELAEQTRDQISLFTKRIEQGRARSALLIGGVNAKEQLKLLQQGVDIVVGTPGRINDFVTSGKLDLARVRFFILDEVDALLQQGQARMLQSLYDQMPKETPDGRRLQVVVCSATLHSQEVKKMAEKIMHFPTWVDLKGMDSVPDTVHHTVVRVDPESDTWWHAPEGNCRTDGVHTRDNTKPGQRSPEALSEAVKLLKYKYLKAAIDKHNMDQAVIFCRTKLDCDNVERFLTQGGTNAMLNEYSCACVHGDRSVPERRSNLSKFKNGDVRFLVCTDVAARGIDVSGIPFVINFTMPDEKQNYIHRIGRVGRADRMGLAISLVATVPEKVWYFKKKPKGKGLPDTRLVSEGGNTIWYNENTLLSDVQEHLGVVVPEIGRDMEVPVNEFDGKVVYGEKRGKGGTTYAGHAALLAPSVQELARLESSVQNSYLTLRMNKGLNTL